MANTRPQERQSSETGRHPQAPSLVELAIIRRAGSYRLYRNGRDLGRRFDYQVDAVEAGLRITCEARATGLATRLLVQDSAGELISIPHGGRG